MEYSDYLKPKRVLMTADTVGGVWSYALELTRALARDGLEVALATMGAPLAPHQREEVRRIPGLQVYESRYKLEWMDDPWEDVAESGVWLLRLEESVRPDVVHLNGYAHGALPWRSPTLVVGHSCVLSWWEAVHGDQAPAAWDRYYREIARGLAAADIVVAPSMAIFWELNKNYGPIHCGRVIYNGRDPGRFRPADKENFILTAGRLWDPAKNLELIHRVADRLPWPVYAAGALSDRPDRSPCNTIRMLGVLSEAELANWYSRSPLFVLPAKYEPFGLCSLEAALSGCALILGDIPSLREIWKEAAVYIRPDDPDGLEEAVVTLIENPVRREELSALARERSALYTPRSMAEGYKAVYRELTEGWHTATSLFQPQKATACFRGGPPRKEKNLMKVHPLPVQ